MRPQTIALAVVLSTSSVLFLLLVIREQLPPVNLLRAINHKIPGYTKADEGQWNGPYVFIFGTDPQPGLIDKFEGGNGSKWEREIELLKKGVGGINAMTERPRFFFIGGDIIDAWPGQDTWRKEQTRDVLAVLSHCQVPTMLISGNHDVGNTPTNSTIEDFQRQYGDDYYSFYVGGVFYIALNSQYFYNSSQVRKLADDQITWLKQELQMAKADQDIKHVVVLMHIPMFTSKADEEDGYFNVPSELRSILLEIYGDGGVSVILSGHFHMNAGGTWNQTSGAKIESVVSSAIGAQRGDDGSGLNVVRVYEDKITHQYFKMEDIPKKVIV